MAKDYKNKKGATGKKYTTVGDVIKVTYTDGSTRVVRPTDASYAVTKKDMQDDISSKKLFKSGNSKTTAQTALGANSTGAGVVTTAKQKAQQDNYKSVVNQRRAQEQAVSGKMPAQQTAQVVNNAINAMLAQKAVNTAKGVTAKALKSGVEHGAHNTVSGLNQGMAGALNTLGRAGMVEGVPYAALANNMAKNLDIQRNYQKAMDTQRIGMGQLQKNLAMQDAVKRQQIASKYGPMTGGEQFVSDIVSNLIPIAPSMAAGVIGGGVAPALGTVAAMAPMYTYARGLSTGQALQDGATVNQANAYGIGKGMVETGTEMLTKNMAGLPGKFEVGKKLADAISNPTAKKVGAAAGDILSGAGEEALAELADPFLQNATYKDGEKIDMDAVLYSALLGGVMTGGVNAAAYTAKNVAKMMQEAKNGQLNGQNEAQIAQKPQDAPEQAQNNATTKGITAQPEVAQEQSSQADFQQNQPKIEQKPEPMKFAPEMEQSKQNETQRHGFSPENATAEPAVEEVATIRSDDFDVNELPDDVRNFYNNIGQKFGGAAKLSKNMPDDINGVYKNGEVILNANKLEDLETIQYATIHEFGHKMKGTSEYDSIQNMALKYFRSVADDPDVTDLDLVDYIKGTRKGTGYEIETDEEAYDELTTMFMEMAFNDSKQIDRICVEQPNVAQRILEFIQQKIADYKAKKGLTKIEKQQYDMLAKTRSLYVDGLRKTQKREQLKNGGLFDQASAQSDSEEIRYSIASVRHDINEGKMHSDLISKGKMSNEEADTFIKNLSDLADHIESFRSTFLDMFEQYGKTDRATLPYKDNSDPLYKISLDFSTLCKKRIITQALIERLQVSRGRALSAEEQIAIRDYLKELKKDNDKIEVACAMCYVEAARLRSPKFINEFINNPVKVVQKYLGTKNDAYKAAINDAGNAKLKELGYAENTKLKDVKANNKDHYWAVKNARDAVKDNYKATSPEEIAIIDFLQNEFEPRMVLTADGMMELKQKQPVVYTALNTFLAGKTKSKALQTGEPYYYGDSSTVSDALIEQMNAENGLRHNSWSDFEIIHLLDLLVAVTELSIRDAKVQYYSKVPAEFYVLKDTGAMGNISLIPAGKTGLNENGELEFDPVEGVPFEEAMKIRKDCSRTAGTVCIGINDAHIKALLESDVIDYVIPYHTSGLGKVQRKMIGVEGWEDYQNYQNEKNAKGKNAENALKFSDWFHPTKQDVATKSGIEIMREAQQEYLRLCRERGITPKFSNTKEGTDFSKHENYWKLLIDRKMIDNDGNIIMQEAVKPSFDFDYMKELVNQEHANSPQESINEGLRALEGLSDDDLRARAEWLKGEKANARYSTGHSRYQDRVNEIKNIKHNREVSKVYSNTVMNSALFTEAEKNIELNQVEYEYDVISERESLHRAAERLEKDRAGTAKELMHKKMYTGEDLDAAMFLLQEGIEKGRETGSYSHARAWLKKIQESGTEGGRMVQAFAKYSRTTAEGIAVQAQRYVQQAEDSLKAGHAKGKMGGREIGKDKDSRKWRTIQDEAKRVQKIVEEAEVGAEKTAKAALSKRLDNLGDSLRNKILDGMDTTLEEKGKIPDSQIVRELYQKLKEEGIPDYSKERGKRSYSKLDFLKDAVQRKDEYAEVFARTQEFMQEKYGDDLETLAVITDVLNGKLQDFKLNQTYSQQTMTDAVYETAKLFDIDLKEIIKENRGNKEAAAEVIKNHIAEYTGVKDNEAAQLAQNVVAAYCNELQRLTDLRLKQLFPELVKPQLKTAWQKNWFDDVMELMNLGAYDNQDIVDIIKAKNKLPVLTNADIQTIYDEVEKAQQFKRYSYEWKVHMAKAQQVAADKMPQSSKEKVTQLKRIMMLSNPRTHSRNIVGNMPLVGTEILSNAVAALIDKNVSDKRGTQRTIGAKPQTGAFVKGFAKGFGETVSDIRQGVNTYRMGEETTSQYEMPRGRTFANPFLNGIDKAVNYGLMFGDRPFFEAHYNKRIAELEQLGCDVSSDEAKADAYAYATDMVFQNDSEMSQGARGLREALNNLLTVGPLALGDFVIPFVQTPANIADKLLDYSPVGLARAAAQLGKSNTEVFDQRLFCQRLGRAFTGTTILALAYALAEAGVITGSSDDDADKRKAMEISGWKPYSIKIGKNYYDYSFFQPIGMILAIGADMYKEGRSVDDLTDLAAVAGAGIKGGADCFFSMSFFSSLTDFFGGYGSPAENMGSAFMDFPTQFAPAIFNAANKSIDPYQRETYDSDPLKRTINKFIAKTPLSQTLPIKQNVYGEDMMQNQGREVLKRTIENMLNPSNVSGEVAHALNDELLRLNKDTGLKTQFLSYPDKKQDLGSAGVYNLNNGEEYNAFIKNANGYAREQMSKLIQDDYYKGLSDEEKIEALGQIEEIGKYKAKQELAKAHDTSYSTDEMESKLELLKECGNDYAKYHAIQNGFSGDTMESKIKKMEVCDKLSLEYATYDEVTGLLSALHDSTDAEGKTIKGKARKDKVYATLVEQRDAGKITDEQMWYIWVDSYNAKTRDKKSSLPYWKDCPYKWIVDAKVAEKAAEAEAKKNRQ